MLKNFLGFLLFGLMALSAGAQLVNPAFIDTNNVNQPGKMSIAGYVDAYYGFDLGKTPDRREFYGVSFTGVNEFNINLAYIDVKYSSKLVRARFIPGFGSYMSVNYAAEPAYLRNIFEASVGMRLTEKGNVWLDAGIIGSPVTNETARSRDHLMLTRSLSAEYVPYYLSGVKVGWEPTQKLSLYGYAVNGWQTIAETNNHKAYISQLEYRPTENLLINWNFYTGNERSEINPALRQRYFSDVFVIYKASPKINITACAYMGRQARRDSVQLKWYSFNGCIKYALSEKLSFASRYEIFSDPDGAVSVRHNAPTRVGLQTQSATFNITYMHTQQLMFRAECREYFGNQPNFLNRNGMPTSRNTWFVTGLNILF